MMRKTQVLCAASIAYTAALLYFSALPAAGLGPGGAYISGNYAHLLAYGAYSVLLYAAFSGMARAGKSMAASLLAAMAVGALAEMLQFFVPGRFCDIMDWLIDVLGALAGLVVVLLNKKTRNWRNA